MESLIVFLIVFVIVACLLFALVYYAPIPNPTFKWLAYLIVILILLLIVFAKFGGVLLA